MQKKKSYVNVPDGGKFVALRGLQRSATASSADAMKGNRQRDSLAFHYAQGEC